MNQLIKNLRIAVLHAKYHRNLKRADQSRKKQDIVSFQRYIYRAEDAWRKLVIIKHK
jgi:hypothetical protein